MDSNVNATKLPNIIIKNMKKKLNCYLLLKRCPSSTQTNKSFLTFITDSLSQTDLRTFFSLTTLMVVYKITKSSQSFLCLTQKSIQKSIPYLYQAAEFLFFNPFVGEAFLFLQLLSSSVHQ